MCCKTSVRYLSPFLVGKRTDTLARVVIAICDFLPSSSTEPLSQLAEWATHKKIYTGSVGAVQFPGRGSINGGEAGIVVAQFSFPHVQGSAKFRHSGQRLVAFLLYT